jgi:hypothetical protein
MRIEIITNNLTQSKSILDCNRYPDKWEIIYPSGKSMWVKATFEHQYELWDGAYKIDELKVTPFKDLSQADQFALYHKATGKDAQRKHKGELITNKKYLDWAKTQTLKQKDREW